jgi:hypothetical protein
MSNETPQSSKPQFFPPKRHHTLSVVLQEVELSQELKVIITDSDPYDAMTYIFQGKPVATEYVASYEKRLHEIQADLAGFCGALKKIQ